MRLLPWQDSIFAKMRNDLNENILVLDGGFLEGEDVAALPNGMIQPYVIVWFAGSVSAFGPYRGIAGVRKDARLGLVHIECVGSSHTHARVLGDEVRSSLVGFVPTEGGELEEDGAPTIRNPISTTTGVDVRYAYPLAFQGIVNTVTPD